jgi:hypothetical protein
MDDGIEQNPAYRTARTFDLQEKSELLLLANRGLTPRFTPTGTVGILDGKGSRRLARQFGCPKSGSGTREAARIRRE